MDFIAPISNGGGFQHYRRPSVKGKVSWTFLIFLRSPAQQEMELRRLRRVGRRARGRAGENVAYSVGQRVKTKRRDAEEALGNNQEFLAQNF